MVTVRFSSDPADDRGVPSFSIDLPGKTRFKDVLNALRAASLPGVTEDVIRRLRLPSKVKLVVTDGPPSYGFDGSSRPLSIFRNQTLLDYFKNYRRHHDLLHRKPHESISQYKTQDDMRYKHSKDPSNPGKFVRFSTTRLSIGAARIQFMRTLRVPDDSSNYLLPPGLGSFPLQPVSKYKLTVPPEIRARGGYIMPMYQREAMWISFAGTKNCAIKIHVGGVNAISGLPAEAPVASDDPDYCVGGYQPWLDGICTEPGVVRQFVAMKMGHGYTIEEQVTGQARHGGIQIDVFPLLDDLVTFGKDGGEENLQSTPAGLGWASGDLAFMTLAQQPATLAEYASRVSPILDLAVSGTAFCSDSQIMIKGLTGLEFAVDFQGWNTVDMLKRNIESKTGTPVDDQRLIYAGMQLKDDGILSDYKIRAGATLHLVLRLRGGGAAPLEEPRMGIAAGGCIEQNIYKDIRPPSAYDEEAAERVWIHTVSTAAWELITGVIAPMSPITPRTYKAHNYPWFSLYDEHLPSLQPTGNFDHVRSVRTLDAGGSPDTAMLDPENPPNCARHPSKRAIVVMRPCAHVACVDCFGDMTVGGASKCHACTRLVEQFVGFKRPASAIRTGGGSVGAWREDEHAIEGVGEDNEHRANVVTLWLAEDRISPLGGHGTSLTARA